MDEKAKAWRVAAGCIIMTSLTTGCYMLLPLYMGPISSELGVSIGQVTLLFTFGACGSIATSLFLGQLLKTVKVRLLVPIAALALVVFHLCVFMAKSIVLIYVGAVFFGFALVIAGFGLSQALITWWFPKNTAKVMSFLSVGLGIATFILSPIIAASIEAFLVRPTALIQGLVVGVIIVVVSIFLLVEHPDSHEIAVEDEQGEKSGAERTAAVQAGLSIRKIFGTYPFWAIFIAVILTNLALTGFTNNASMFYQTIGLDGFQAALCISIYSIFSLIWAPLFGALADKAGPGIATAVCATIGAAILIAAVFITGFIGAAIIGALVAALSFSGLIGPFSYPKIYGMREAGTLIGYANVAASAGSMLGAPIAGFIFDATGAYTAYLLVASVCAILCMILVFVGTSKRASQYIKAAEGPVN